MSFYNFFKNLFGIDGSKYYENERSNDYENQERNIRIWEETEEDCMPNTSNNGFPLYTDPLEIHRYFEQQMDEILRSFSGLFRSDESTQINDFQDFCYSNKPNCSIMETDKQNLRDHYLKPGYEAPRKQTLEIPLDSDLDGKIDAGHLDSIIRNKSTQITPNQPHTATGSYFFGQIVTSRRIQKLDGSVEVHTITRDSQGNEETTISRQKDGKQYTTIKRRNIDGKEEKIEDRVNMDEKDMSHFNNLWQPNESPYENPNKYFPFDKFFK